MIRYLCALASCLLALALLSCPAFAHATLLSSSPPAGAALLSPPKVVALTFNEPVAPLAFKLIDAVGAVTELSATATDGRVIIALPVDLSGAIIVTWRVSSPDGHPIGGSIAFSVGADARPGAPSSSSPSLDLALPIWLATFLLYSSAFWGLGGLLFDATTRQSATTLRRIDHAAIGIAGATLLLLVPLQGLDSTGGSLRDLASPGTWMAAFKTSFGATAIGLAIALTGAIAASVTTGRKRWILALAAVACMAVALSLTGHATTATPAWLARLAVIVHIVSVAFWIGALPRLLAALARASDSGSRILAAFSEAAPAWIAAILISGVALAVLQIGWEPSTLSPYLIILIVKLGCVALLLAVASYNRWVLTAPARAGEPRAKRRLRFAIIAELILLAVVLGLVGGWRFTPPPRELPVAAVQLAASTHLHGAGVMANIKISGADTFEVAIELTPTLGGEFAPKSVVAEFSGEDASFGPIELDALQDTPTSWRISGLRLPGAGTWKLDLAIRVDDFTLVHLRGAFTLAKADPPRDAEN